MAETNDPPPVNDDSTNVVVLMTAADEMQAAIILSALNGRGVPAESSGALTSGFRAEAPGGVKILVRQGDLEQARSILDDVERQSESA